MPFGKKDVKKKSSNFEKKEILGEAPLESSKKKKLTKKQRFTLLFVLFVFMLLPMIMAVVARRGKLPGFDRLLIPDNPFSSTVTIVSGGQREQDRLDRLNTEFLNITRNVSGVWSIWVYDFTRSKPYAVNPSENFVLEPNSQLSLLLASSSCSSLGYVAFDGESKLSGEWKEFIPSLLDSREAVSTPPQSLQSCISSGDISNDVTAGGVIAVPDIASEVRKMAEGGATLRFRSSLYELYSNSPEYDRDFLFAYNKFNPRSFYGIYHSSTKNQYLAVIFGGGTVESEVRQVLPQVLSYLELEFGQ